MRSTLYLRGPSHTHAKKRVEDVRREKEGAGKGAGGGARRKERGEVQGERCG
jgi:hypothetical protein